jgi:putative hydrolase of the HAD superfamily
MMSKKKTQKITTLFTDIGGVLLTNGWDRNGRAAAIKKFKLDAAETEERHHLTFDTYEEGKLTLDEYLERIVFYKKRDFSKKEFKNFMYSCSQPFDDMIKMVKELKQKYHLKIAVVSNEGRELNEYRIDTFKLNSFIDFFISSSFVHFRKPDADIFKIALDIAQVKASEVLYLEDREMFAQVAEGLGIKSIVHKEYKTTLKKFEEFGFRL